MTSLKTIAAKDEINWLDIAPLPKGQSKTELILVQNCTIGCTSIAIFGMKKHWYCGAATSDQIYIETYSTFTKAIRVYQDAKLFLVKEQIPFAKR